MRQNLYTYKASVQDGYGKRYTKSGSYSQICQFVFNHLINDSLATYSITDEFGDEVLDYGFDKVVGYLDSHTIEKCPDDSILIDDRWHIYSDYGVVYDEFVGDDYDEVSDIPHWVFDIRDVYTGKWEM